jgi:hypothetical protein
VVKVLPKGLAELQAKGKKPEDILGHPVLCVASTTDDEELPDDIKMLLERMRAGVSKPTR